MNKIVIVAALIGALAAAGSAFAQPGSVRSNERFCLESTAGGGGHGGGGAGSLLCRYETMAQCVASKTTQGDRCMVNPWLAFQGK